MRRRRRSIESVVHDEIETLRSELHASWSASLELFAREVGGHHEADRWERSEHSIQLTKALGRVADALDGVTAHLQLERRERTAQTQLLESVLREFMLLGGPTNVALGDVAPTVLGGTIDLEQVERGNGQLVSADDGSLCVGCPVEVHSRYQHRWCHGFSVAEVVRDDQSVHYRLVRHMDHEVLPVLFEPDELRAVNGDPAPHPPNT